MDNCKFKIHIENTNEFQCAVLDREDGWAYTYNEGEFSPCNLCLLKKESEAKTIVKRQLDRWDYWKLTGTMVSRADWKEIDDIWQSFLGKNKKPIL